MYALHHSRLPKGQIACQIHPTDFHPVDRTRQAIRLQQRIHFFDHCAVLLFVCLKQCRWVSAGKHSARLNPHLHAIDGIHPREIQPHALFAKSVHGVMLRPAPVVSIALAQEISQTVFYLVILCALSASCQPHTYVSPMFCFTTAHFFLLFFWQTVQCLQPFFIFCPKCPNKSCAIQCSLSSQNSFIMSSCSIPRKVGCPS